MAGRYFLKNLQVRLWYWTQLAIWPFIRDTTCYYCIFLRGVICGIVLTGGITVAIWLNGWLRM